MIPHLLVSPHAIHGKTVVIEEAATLHHLLDVLRARVGGRIECFDGQGGLYEGRIEYLTRQQVRIALTSHRRPAEGPLAITLAPAIPKGDRFDWMLQKATELGVMRVVPLVTRRTVPRPTPEQGQRKRDRWLRIAAAAAQQCGRATVPMVEPPQPFERFVPQLGHSPLILMPTLTVSGRPLADVLRARLTPEAATLLIGPEGDFTTEEVAQAVAQGAHAVSLGRLTLRSETAAIALVAVLEYAFWG